jgi:hypothetical protein
MSTNLYLDAVGADESKRLPRYDANLLGALEDDHRRLAQLYAAVMKAHRQGDLVRCMAALGAFRATLVAHLQREDRELYAYLQHSFDRYAPDAPRLRGMLDAMQVLGEALERFGTDYFNALDDAAAHARFARDLNRIGVILANRIREEEAVLYPMYLPQADDAF